MSGVFEFKGGGGAGAGSSQKIQQLLAHAQQCLQRS